MNVRELRRGEEARWDEYVRTSEYSTPQHLSAWKQVMGEAFNSETHYLLAEENGAVTGILPLIHVRSVLAGHYVTSYPGGLCANDDDTAVALLDHAREFTRATNARYLILRDGRKKWNLPGLITNEEHVTFLTDVTPNLDQIRQGIKKRSRQLLNQATGDNLKAVLGLENLNDYYPIYAKAMRELGTPTLGMGFFKSMTDRLPINTNLIAINYGDNIVGGGFFAPLKQTVYCLWSGLLRKYYDYHISHLLHWEIIRYAHQNGYQWVDFGRCRKKSGTYEFKKGFGGQVHQLYQQFHLNGSSQPPDVGGEMREDLKYRIFVSMWRKLPPLVSEVLGPVLRKQVPFG